jgi:hypothetical protein
MRYLWLLCLFSLVQVNTAFSSASILSTNVGGVPRTDKLFSWNHAQVSMSASTAQRLWAESSPTAFRCLYHPFVSGLALGNLPVRTFQHYIGIDPFVYKFVLLTYIRYLTRRSGFFLSFKLCKGLHEGVGPSSFKNGQGRACHICLTGCRSRTRTDTTPSNKPVYFI